MDMDLIKNRSEDEARATLELSEFLGVVFESLAETHLEVYLTSVGGTKILFTAPRDEVTCRLLGRLSAFGYDVACALTDDNYLPLRMGLVGQITGRPDEIDPPDGPVVLPPEI